MARSPEEISEINRRNAARSTGPRTEQGKSHSRMNSYKHGMRSEKLVLLIEPQEWVHELTAEWEDYYLPSSPGRKALVERAVMATVHHKRSRCYVTSSLDKQVRGAELAYNMQQEDVVLRYLALLKADPAAAVRGLNRSAAGLRRLMSEWLGLKDDLIDHGHWVPSRREHATRLLGSRPEEPNNETAFMVRYYNVAAREPLSDDALAALTRPGCLPDTLYYLRAETPPTPDEALKWLLQTVVNELDTLGGLEEKLRVHYENHDRLAAIQRASLLAPEAMPLWLRYERMHDSMFYRAYNALERPEALRSAPDGPVVGSRPEEPQGASCDAGLGNELSDASVPEGAPAGEGPVVVDEADAERQTDAVVADEPVVAVAEVAPAEAWVEEPIAVDSRADEGPGVTDERVVERQTKRVAPVGPVALAIADTSAVPGHVPAVSVADIDPAEVIATKLARLRREFFGDDPPSPPPDEGAEDRFSLESPWPAAADSRAGPGAGVIGPSSSSVPPVPRPHDRWR